MATLMDAQQAQANPCSVLGTWKRARTTMPAQSAPIAEWSAYQGRLSRGLVSTAQMIQKRYMNGAWMETSSKALAQCMSATEREDLSYEVQAVFWEDSLARLSKSGGAKAALAQIIGDSKFQLFRLVGHFKVDSDQDELEDQRAGFHRGRRSIFMDFTQIEPNDWLLIFVHEILHEVDSVLRDAVPVFGDLQLRSYLEKLARKIQNPISLSGADRAQLDRWLEAALNRGLGAEVRAWAVTFAIYLEGRADGTFNKIEWMESILSHRSPHESLQRFALRYLDPRFADSDKSPFDQALFATGLKLMRVGITHGSTEIKFGPELLNLLSNPISEASSSASSTKLRQPR